MGIYVNKGVELAIQKVGSQRDLAKLIKKSQPAVSGYLYGKPHPVIALEIEKKTGVSVKLIRPDIFGADETFSDDD